MTTKNMKTNRLTILAVGMATILMLGVSACHHHGGLNHSGFGSDERLTDQIVSELDLTDKQEALLKDIVRDLEEARQKRGDHEELQRLFFSQLESEDLDEEYLRLETGRLISELESAADTFITGLGAFHSSLNAEQRAKLPDFVERGNRIRSWHN